MNKKNLWILTEECPTKEIIKVIFNELNEDFSISFFANTIRIIPILQDKKFTFTYKVIGIDCEAIEKIYIKIVSGYSSFVDYLVFFKNTKPEHTDIPIYAIEETKTDDSESRNTGVFQRCSKFVYLDMIYHKQPIKKIMYYSLKVNQKEFPSETNIFGSQLLATLGVKILGKIQTKRQKTQFLSIKEVIDAKNSMRLPPAGNVPIRLNKISNDCIEISGRLIKGESLAHDPNIGALSIISAVLRKLGWKGKIEITQHGLKQNHVNGKNKFILIANQLKINLKDLNLKVQLQYPTYWKYDDTGEKLASIFIHLIIEEFTNGMSIFNNHAGCEKSYFINSKGKPFSIKKYTNREEYKAGDKNKIIHIPDLIILDEDRKEIINIEGKTYKNRFIGIKEIENFDAIESIYISPNYPKYSIYRTVVIYGGTDNEINEIKIGFMLNKLGSLVLGVKAPKIFKESVCNLFNYWHIP